MAFLIDIIQFHCTTEHKQVIKSSVACANLTAFSLIYKVLQCLHDVLNLFLDKAYLKMNDTSSSGGNIFIILVLFYKC